MAKTQIDKDAARRRKLANNPAINAELRWYFKHLNAKLGAQGSIFGTTTTTTSTTSTTTSTTTTT
jgi:hypothetical protein